MVYALKGVAFMTIGMMLRAIIVRVNQLWDIIIIIIYFKDLEILVLSSIYAYSSLHFCPLKHASLNFIYIVAGVLETFFHFILKKIDFNMFCGARAQVFFSTVSLQNLFTLQSPSWTHFCSFLMLGHIFSLQLLNFRTEFIT